MDITANDLAGASRPAAGSGAPSQQPRGNVEFDGQGISGLATKGVLLTVLTLGLYRFWLITDLRRFFWSRTRIGGSPLEYTGTGLEIFLGFLIAVTVLLPIYVGFFGVGGLWTPPPWMPVLGMVILAPLLFYATYRARRYRLNRTLWRGLRFGLVGSPWAYAGRGILWSLALIPTFGIAYPWMAASLERYWVGNMRFAGNAFHSEAKGRDIVGPYVLVVAAYVAGGALLFGLVVAWGVVMAAIGADPSGSAAGQSVVAFIAFGLVSAAWVLSIFLAQFYFMARKISRFGSAISLGEARLDIVVPARRLMRVGAAYLCMLIGIAVLAVGGAVALAMAAGGISSPMMAIAPFLGLIGFSLATFWVQIVYLERALWRSVAHGVQVENLDSVDGLVAQSQQEASGRDEGFADALMTDFEIGL